MNNLPEKFPEYIIMYKTLSKKILELNKEKLEITEFKKNQDKIKKYELERTKIRNMFPEKFFETYLSDK